MAKVALGCGCATCVRSAVRRTPAARISINKHQGEIIRSIHTHFIDFACNYLLPLTHLEQREHSELRLSFQPLCVKDAQTRSFQPRRAGSVRPRPDLCRQFYRSCSTVLQELWLPGRKGSRSSQKLQFRCFAVGEPSSSGPCQKSLCASNGLLSLPDKEQLLLQTFVMKANDY